MCSTSGPRLWFVIVQGFVSETSGLIQPLLDWFVLWKMELLFIFKARQTVQICSVTHVKVGVFFWLFFLITFDATIGRETNDTMVFTGFLFPSSRMIKKQMIKCWKICRPVCWTIDFTLKSQVWLQNYIGTPLSLYISPKGINHSLYWQPTLSRQRSRASYRK